MRSFKFTKIFIACTLALSIAISPNISADTTDNKQETTIPSNINEIKSISLNRKNKSLMAKKKYVLKAYVTYMNDDDNKESYSFKSNNSNVATVNNKGIVKAIKEGKTYIVCSSASGKVKARCKIIVKKPVNKIKSIKLDKTNIRTAIKKKRFLNTTISYGNNKDLEKEPVKWISSDNNIVTVNSKGVLKGRNTGNATITVKSKYSKKSAKCHVKVEKKLKFVAVTFDDGPGDYTDKVVNALKKNNSYATFFMLGKQVKAHPNQLKHAFENGNQIGSHSYSHQNLNRISNKSIKREIKDTETEIKKHIGQKPSLFRPPYGNYNSTVTKYVNVPMIYWNIDTLDWKNKNSKYVYNYLMHHSYAGSLILMHDIHPTTVNGFTKALPKLVKKGYEFVTVSELYSIYNKKLKPKKMHYGPKNDR